MNVHVDQVDSSHGRIYAHYRLQGSTEQIDLVARALAVEETIEFPPELVTDSDIANNVVGRVEDVESSGESCSEVVISYSVEVTGWELPQLINVLFGNCSMWPGVRLEDVELPESFFQHFAGPRFGTSGVRDLLGAYERPLLATAIKPMGTSAQGLAEMVFDCAAGGIDLIKDDHGLANQPYADFADRVRRCGEAVHAANDRYGTRALYMPCVNAPLEDLDSRVEIALKAGAGGLLVLPGIVGYDTIRYLSLRSEGRVPIMAHPSMLGSLVVEERQGMAPGLVFGTLPRLAGADLSAFPHAGGRFSFSEKDCATIAEHCRADLGSSAEIMPAAGGGMTLERVREVAEFYGNDVAILIGGDLHRGSLRSNAESFRARLEEIG
jgi:ribulose-bisphosphate carboxylase large chain